MNLGEYRIRLDGIMLSFARALGRLLRAAWDPDTPVALRTSLAPAVTAVVVEHRERAYDTAVEFLEGSARDQGVEGPVYVPDLAFYGEASAATVLREDLRGSVDEAVTRVTRRLTVHVENAARATVVRSVEDGVDPADPADAEHLERTRLSPSEVARRKVEERAARAAARRREREPEPAPLERDLPDQDTNSAWDALAAELEAEQAEAEELDRIARRERDEALAEAASSARGVDGPRRGSGRDSISGRELYLDKDLARDLRAGYDYEGERPKAWARVLTGAENCGFCVVLASRGAVYKSARAAGVARASQVMNAPDATGYLNTYHDNCDCLVVPVYDFKRWDGLEQWSATEAFYDETIREAEWVDEDGEVQVGITYKRGPSPGSGNQVFNAVDRKLRQLAKNGGKVPVAELRKHAKRGR